MNVIVGLAHTVHFRSAVIEECCHKAQLIWARAQRYLCKRAWHDRFRVEIRFGVSEELHMVLPNAQGKRRRKERSD